MADDEYDILDLDEQIPGIDDDDSRVDEAHFIAVARTAFEESENFLDSGAKERWRRNYALSQSLHPEGSKYHTDAYKHRSRTFRGKTEASIRKHEAALAVAMFSNRDVVSITAENADDEMQSKAADAICQVVNYRLDKSIKWFLTAIGGYHETMVVGDVVSEQYWDYVKKDDQTVIDKPAVELYPLENVHISPSADWRDPIASSPYVIVELPMFVGDVQERMEDDWREYSISQIKAAGDSDKYDSVKHARAGDKNINPNDGNSSVSEFDVVYIHKNFIRTKGEDYFYYTIGTTLLLTDPVPIAAVYPHLKYGERPLVWGTATIEPHKVYRRSLVDRVVGSQAYSNDLSNQRRDNVSQVLNKRKYVKRGAGVDYTALLRNIPGATILMDELDAVRPEDTVDVTSSSYREQQLIDTDFDELAGSFSNASVANNRALNETVGGMKMLEGNSNTLTEYELRILVETWVEPVVRQIVQMVQFYEDDLIIQKVTASQLTHNDLQVPIDVRVSVGFGSTDPQQKVQKLVYGISALAKVAPQLIAQHDLVEIAREVWAALGYNDGKKFLPDKEQEDPRIQQLMQELQKLQKVVETDQVKVNGQLQLEQLKGQNRARELMMKLKEERTISFTEMAITRGLKVAELEQKTGTDSGKMNLELLKEMNKRMEIANQERELSHKINTGKQGI
jgi:hypothetical protein